MENEKSLFSLDIDATGKDYLNDIAKWAKFLAVTGFAALGIILIVTVIASVISHNKMVELYGEGSAGAGEMVESIIAATIFGVIYFFPCYFLLRFAVKMQVAIPADDTASLNEAFKNLKKTFRYVGVITIIFLAFFTIGLLANIT